MISYQTARSLIEQHTEKVMPVEEVPLFSAVGRVAADSVVAKVSVPPFANSAMDGYALRAEDVATACQDNPVSLNIVACRAAGDEELGFGQALQTEQAVEIMTGAKLPLGCDAVVPVEEVSLEGDRVVIKASVKPHQHIRYAGDDFAEGCCLLPAGTRITPNHIAVLASSGIATVLVRCQPTVVLVTTGQEILPVTATLSGSCIYDANGPYVLATLSEAQIPCVHAGNIGDDPEALRRVIVDHSDAEVIISTGAVSKGRWDFVPDVLQSLGAKIIFHRVAIKPGKPVLFAVLPDGRYFFGLPGNPISTAVGLRFFVEPLLRKLLGMAAEIISRVKLNTPCQKRGDLLHFLKATLWSDPNQGMVVDVLQGQESFKLLPMTRVNVWVLLEEQTTSVAAGELVRCVQDGLLT